MNSTDGHFYRSAIDTGLKANQVTAIQEIVNYIVKYQNKWTSSFIFRKNMPALLEKGISISHLLDSKIFSFPIDFDQWPSTHHDDGEYARPYNAELFKLRYNYRVVFPEDNFAEDSSKDSSKSYKINYKLNVLPMIDEHVIMDENGEKEIVNQGYSFIEYCIDSGELDIFEVENF